MLTAQDIMTRQVITVAQDMPVKELATLFLSKKIGGAPVVDTSGDLVGVVTESDLIDQTKNVHIPTVISILDSVLFLESPGKMDQEIKKIAGSTVGDICARNPVTVDEDTPLSDIATIMSEKKIHTLPVLFRGTLVGVIGKADLIRAISQGL
ncbi:MAG: CBS domain-containing protein [Desulfobulbaceae bacterium]|nr:CBS domain-containing protein [Desulfobulbaceae bacterium]MDP2106009.1 CBS domain-containing protein [Desulfobulbaceae bacterium]